MISTIGVVEIIGTVLTLCTLYRDIFDDFDVDMGLNYFKYDFFFFGRMSKYETLMGKKFN